MKKTILIIICLVFIQQVLFSKNPLSAEELTTELRIAQNTQNWSKLRTIINQPSFDVHLKLAYPDATNDIIFYRSLLGNLLEHVQSDLKAPHDIIEILLAKGTSLTEPYELMTGDKTVPVWEIPFMYASQLIRLISINEKNKLSLLHENKTEEAAFLDKLINLTQTILDQDILPITSLIEQYAQKRRDYLVLNGIKRYKESSELKKMR